MTKSKAPEQTNARMHQSGKGLARQFGKKRTDAVVLGWKKTYRAICGA